MKKLFSLLLALALISLPMASCYIASGSSSSLNNSSLSTDGSSSISVSSEESTSESLSENSSSLDSSTDSSSDSSSIEELQTRTITYKMRLHDHSIINVMEKFWVSGGHYPTSYMEGVGDSVDDLKEKINVGNYYIEFLGWYLDEACKTPFDGVIDSNERGDITLYAKTRNVAFSTSEDSSGWVTEQ